MNQIILGNKLLVPEAHGLLPRLNLIQQLDQASLLPLTVIQASAGYGKTSLVCDWLQHCPVSCCWLSLDEKDDLPSGFWLYLCVSLRSLDEECVHETENILKNLYIEDYSLVCDTLVASLNKLTRKWNRPSRCVLVLDDFHVINHPQVLTSFSRFLDYKPYWLQVIITSRTLPRLGVPQRLSKKKAHLIGSDQLAFDQEESNRLLNSRLNKEISQEQYQEVFQLSKGWPAAIQLMALALESNVVLPTQFQEVNDDLMSDFLFEEVYLQLDEDLKELLRSLCVVQRFSASLIEVFNEPNSAEYWLKKLMESGLFITKTLEDRQTHYKIHDLFRTWLLSYAQEHQASQVEQDRKIAIQWLVQQSQYEDALHLAIAMEDWSEASVLMRHLFQSFLQNGHLDHIQKLLQAFPINEVIQRPHLSLLQSLLHFYQYQQEQLETYLNYTKSSIQQLEQSLEQNAHDKNTVLRHFGLLEVEDVELIKSGYVIIESMMARFSGDSSSLMYCNRIIDDIVNESHPLACWMIYGQFVDAYLADDVENSLRLGKQALQKSKDVGDSMCTVVTLSWLLHALIYHGQVHYALRLAEDHLLWIKQTGLNSLPNIPSFYCALCHLYIETFQLEKAQKCFHDLENTLHAYTEPREVLFCKYYLKYKLLMALGKVNEASAWIEDIKLYQQTHLGYSSQSQAFSIVPKIEIFEYLSQLRQGNAMPLFQWASTALEEDDVALKYETERFLQLVGLTLMGQDTMDELDDMMTKAKHHGANSRWISIWLFKLVFLYRAGEQGFVMEQLPQLLTCSKDMGYGQLILDGGPNVLDLLNEAKQKGIEIEYCQTLINQAVDPSVSLKSDLETVDVKSSPAIEHHHNLPDLTQRESEVLSQLAIGAKNQAIAEALGISLATVKRHVQNIYGKLQVNTRTEAALLYNRHPSPSTLEE